MICGALYEELFAFLRSEPVRLGLKAGFLGAVVYLALRYLVGRP